MSTTIRQATAEDNEPLLALTRATPMAGTIALRIDRDPDFFALLRHRGDGAVFVAEERGEIIACISVAIRDGYVCGVPEPIAYVADLKVHPAHVGTRVVLRLLQVLRSHIEAHDVDLVWSVAAEGNSRVLPLFAGRAGISRFVSAGRFIVDELLCWPFAKRSAQTIEDASTGDREEIDALVDGFHRSRELAPSGSQSDDAMTTLVAREGTRVVATLELFDPTPLKRNVLLGAPLATRILLKLVRPLGGIPRVGEAVRLVYIRRFACADGKSAALQALIGHARIVARRHHFAFAAVGLHDRDPLRRIVRGIPRFSFTSCAFVTSLRGSRSVDTVANGIPFVDFGSV